MTDDEVRVASETVTVTAEVVPAETSLAKMLRVGVVNVDGNCTPQVEDTVGSVWTQLHLNDRPAERPVTPT